MLISKQTSKPEICLGLSIQLYSYCFLSLSCLESYCFLETFERSDLMAVVCFSSFCFSHVDSFTVYIQTNLRSLLSKPNDPIPKEDRNNAVYQLNCKDCEAVSVGKTKETLYIRAEEHIIAIKSEATHCRTMLEIQS